MDFIRFGENYINLKNIVSISFEGKTVILRCTGGLTHTYEVNEEVQLIPLVTRLERM